MTLNYQQQLTPEDFDRVRLSPHMVWVRDSKKLPTRAERAFHLNKFWQYLKVLPQNLWVTDLPKMV